MKSERRTFVRSNRSTVTLADIRNNCAIAANGCWAWSLACNRKGYGTFRFNGKAYATHRYVMHLVHDFDLKSAKHILHRCDNPGCVNPGHLYVGIERDNTRDKVQRKRHSFGERVAQSILTEQAVLDIFRKYAEGVDQVRLARKFGVSKQTISAVLRRKNWAHVYIPAEYLYE